MEQTCTVYCAHNIVQYENFTKFYYTTNTYDQVMDTSEQIYNLHAWWMWIGMVPCVIKIKHEVTASHM